LGGNAAPNLIQKGIGKRSEKEGATRRSKSLLWCPREGVQIPQEEVGGEVKVVVGSTGSQNLVSPERWWDFHAFSASTGG